MRVRNLAAPSARALQNHSPRREEGAGNAGCALHPRSRVQNVRKNAHEHTGTDGAIRHSLRNGLTAYAALSSATSSFLSPSPRELEGSSAPGRVDAAFARLSTSNGCQDHAVLPYAASPVVRALVSAHGPEPALRSPPRARRCLRPPQPAPTFVTMANAPLAGRDGESCTGDLGARRNDLFLRGELDR
jgi:hypothetical protein